MTKMMSTALGGLLACLLGSLGCAPAADDPKLDEAQACDDGDGECEQNEATRLSGLIADLIEDTDFTALVQPLNPVVNTGNGCNSAKVFVNSIAHGAVEVAVSPIAGGSDTSISVSSPVATGQVKFRAACINATASFTMTASAYRVRGAIAPRVDDGAVAVAFDDVTSAFENLRIDVVNVPAFIEDILVSQLEGRVAQLLNNQIGVLLPPRIDAFLSGQGIVELSAAIARLVDEADYTALFGSLNPIVNTGDGCNSAKVFIDSAGHAEAGATLSPVAGGLDTSISVPLVILNGHIQYRAICLNASASFTIAADAYNASGRIVPRLEDGSIAAGFESAGSTFDNFSIAVDNVPGFIENLISTQVRDRLVQVLDPQVAENVPLVVDQFYSDFFTR